MIMNSPAGHMSDLKTWIRAGGMNKGDLTRAIVDLDEP